MTLLINPPSPFLIDERVFPPLGLLKVAEAVDAEVLDLAGVADIESILDDLPPQDIIGIGATTPQIKGTMRIVRHLKKSQPQAVLVIGGPHVTLTYAGGDRAASVREELESTFDVVCVGDGEGLMKRVVAGERGLLRADRRQDPDFLKTSDTPNGRHRIDIHSYKYEIDGCKATSLVSQYGCPFNCGFCGGRDSHAFRVIRKRDYTTTVDEVESLYLDYGFTGFMFLDDELNVNPQMIQLMDGLADLQSKHGVDFRLRGFLKAELFNDEQAAAMYRGGFREILSGFEAAHPKILQNIRKRATVDDNKRVIELSQKHNMRVKALMSCGHPGESEESVRSIEDFLLRERPDDFDLTVISPYPGSPYYDHSVPDGDYWRYEIDGDVLFNETVDWNEDPQFYKGMPGSYVSYVWTDKLSKTDICMLRDEVEYNARVGLGLSGPRIQGEASMGQS